jgi:hypothetical protein
MNNKSQKTLLISALVIICVTVVGLIGLRLAVEKISRMSAPPMALMVPPPNLRDMNGTEDAVEDKNRAAMPEFPPPMPPRPNGGRDDKHQRRPMRPDGNNRNGKDVYRRMRNGKDAPDIRRTTPPFPGTDDSARNMPPGYPPNMPNGYAPPSPSNMTQEEREMFEKEMERRRELYFGSPDGAPSQDYYPPPPPPYYDDSYDPYQDSEEDYDEYDFESPYYDPGYEGRNHHEDKKDVKTADMIETAEWEYGDEMGLEEDMADYYLDE